MAHIGWEVYYLAKKYGAVFTDDRHFVDDCAKLVEEKFKSTNSKSMQCQQCINQLTDCICAKAGLPCKYSPR